MADERAGGASGPRGTGSRHRRRHRSRFGRYGSSSRHEGAADRAFYAALDLGTNNCRLLVAHPTRDSFRVVDAFSRIVRLGEGLGRTRRLADAAMDRADRRAPGLRDEARASRPGAHAADRDRGGARGRERRRVSCARQAGVRPLARNHRPRDRSAARRAWLRASARSRRRRGDPVRHRRRLLGTRAFGPRANGRSRAADRADARLGIALDGGGFARRTPRRRGGFARYVRVDGGRSGAAGRGVCPRGQGATARRTIISLEPPAP